MIGELTRAEMRTLHALADGMTAPEIAREQFVQECTVKAHVKSLRFKLEARNAAHVVALAYHHGILIPKVAA